MSTKPPEPIATYFAAANLHDVDAALAPFDQTAVVMDEGRQRTGLAAIREWIGETTAKYRPTAIITGVAPGTENTVVTARVSGAFPGSPVEIRYSFTVEDRKITRLEIQ